MLKRLRYEREARGWSRAELARRAWVVHSDYGQFETGRRIPYPKQLERIAKALGWTGAPEALLEEVDGHDEYVSNR